MIVCYSLATVLLSISKGFLFPFWMTAIPCIYLLLTQSKASGAPNSFGLDALNGILGSILLIIVTAVLSGIGVLINVSGVAITFQ